MPSGLPVEAVVEEVQKALSENASAVLQAPPGAGKTTGVPLHLLNAPWLNGRKIVLLAPRRLAARAAAGRMADLLQESVGQTVGYRVRLDSQSSPFILARFLCTLQRGCCQTRCNTRYAAGG